MMLTKRERVSPAAFFREDESFAVPDWLAPGKQAAICFSVDDVHPGKATDAYEAGGDLDQGQLGHVGWLLERHPQLRVTLFTTADWREISPTPTRKFLAGIPWLRDYFYLAGTLPAGTMRLSRHPRFVDYLKRLPRVEVGLHGLHHLQRGPNIPVEFEKKDAGQCRRILQRMLAIFEEAGLPYVRGMSPPGWHLSDALMEAMVDVGLQFVASARDIRTPISRSAATNMSGLKNASLIYPIFICGGKLLHFSSNFQATSPFYRAREIIEHGGLLAIKAHIIKNAVGHIALDGLDELYRNYLDLLLTRLEDLYGESLWWATMGEISDHASSCRETSLNKAQANA